MSEELKPVEIEVAGKVMLVNRPSDDQLLAWVGLAGALGSGEYTAAELAEDVSALIEAMRDLIVEEEDRRTFRRACIMGTAKLTDLLSAITGAAEEPTKPAAKVRRGR